MNKKIKAVCIAEALGLLDEPLQRTFWVHPLNVNREKSQRFSLFFENLRKYPDKFFDYYRMSITSFDELLEYIREYITKKNTSFRNAISAEERLTVTTDSG